MKIFLTGGTGFIGSHFLKQGLKKGYEIKALKRKSNSKPKILLDRAPLWLPGNFNTVKIEELKDCDVLVHLAAHSVIYPFDTLENCIKYNVTEPLKLFLKAKEAGINKFIVAGSCFEYGNSGNRYEFIPTDAALEPTQTYSTSKAMASLAFLQFALEHKVELSIHRIFHVFGEGESPNRFWPSLKRAAINDEDFNMTKGEQIRDFVEVSEVAKHFLEYVEKTLSKGAPEIINVGSGIPQSLLEFARFWWKKWDAKGKLRVGTLPYRQGEIMRYVPAIVKVS